MRVNVDATLDSAKTGEGARAESVRALARSSLPLALALAAAALAIGGVVRARHAGDLGTEVSRAGLVVVWAAAGLVLTLRRPDERMGRLVLWAAGLAGVGSLAASALRAWSHGVALSVPAVDPRALRARSSSQPWRWSVCTCFWARPTGALIGGPAPWSPSPTSWPACWPRPVGSAAGTAAVARRSRGGAGGDPRADRVQGCGIGEREAVGRQRMQWLGWALAVGAEVVVVAVALRLLVGWPSHFAAVVVVASVAIPVALVGQHFAALDWRVDRLVVHTISVAGLGWCRHRHLPVHRRGPGPRPPQPASSPPPVDDRSRRGGAAVRVRP